MGLRQKANKVSSGQITLPPTPPVEGGEPKEGRPNMLPLDSSWACRRGEGQKAQHPEPVLSTDCPERVEGGAIQRLALECKEEEEHLLLSLKARLCSTSSFYPLT